jgi:acyl carrier protein
MSNSAHALASGHSDAAPDVLSAMAAFFKTTTPGALAGPLTPETPLLDSGLLDSLSMLQLTTHLSDTFGVEFEDDDFTMENFATAGRVAALVTAKISRSG